MEGGEKRDEEVWENMFDRFCRVDFNRRHYLRAWFFQRRLAHGE